MILYSETQAHYSIECDALLTSLFLRVTMTDTRNLSLFDYLRYAIVVSAIGEIILMPLLLLSCFFSLSVCFLAIHSTQSHNKTTITLYDYANYLNKYDLPNGLFVC